MLSFDRSSFAGSTPARCILATQREKGPRWACCTYGPTTTTACKKGASLLPFFARDGINSTNCIILHYPVGLVLSLSMPTGYASLAQWVERSAVNRNVTGSSPGSWLFKVNLIEKRQHLLYVSCLDRPG